MVKKKSVRKSNPVIINKVAVLFLFLWKRFFLWFLIPLTSSWIQAVEKSSSSLNEKREWGQDVYFPGFSLPFKVTSNWLIPEPKVTQKTQAAENGILLSPSGFQ